MAGGNAMFLDLTGADGKSVEGSCADEQFKEKIELLSFSFTVTPVPRTRSKASTPSSSKPKPQASKPSKKGEDDEDDEDDKKKDKARKDDSITITKVIDIASATLFKSYCMHLQPDRAKEFKQAVLTCRAIHNGTPLPFLALTFTGLFIIDYQLESVDTKTSHPTEKVTFSYKTMKIRYTREGTSDGKKWSPRIVSWDRAARQT